MVDRSKVTPDVDGFPERCG